MALSSELNLIMSTDQMSSSDYEKRLVEINKSLAFWVEGETEWLPDYGGG